MKKKPIPKKIGKQDTKSIEKFCKWLSEVLEAEVIAEYRFHPVRKWRIDYFIEKKNKKIGLEVEGGIWVKGRHINPKGFLKDMEKYNAMSSLGIFLIRTTPKELIPQYKYVENNLLRILKEALS